MRTSVSRKVCSRGIPGEARIFCALSVFIRLAEQLGHLSLRVFLGNRGCSGDRPRFIPSWPLHLFVPWPVPGLASLSLTYKVVVILTCLKGHCMWTTCCRLVVPVHIICTLLWPSALRNSDCTRALWCLSWQFLCGPPIRHAGLHMWRMDIDGETGLKGSHSLGVALLIPRWPGSGPGGLARSLQHGSLCITWGFLSQVW